jgi:SAM-dependent methyltransferase
MTTNNNDIPSWALHRPKKTWQIIIDFIMSPLRMIFLPDIYSEKLHLSSLRAERFAIVLPNFRGTVLDIGAGDNMLLRTYKKMKSPNDEDYADSMQSVGVDISGCSTDDYLVVETSAKLPLDDNHFDTVSFVACINHIPERQEALREAKRVLKPGGRVIITMINRSLGEIGHKIWWYSEDKHREVDENELMGMNPNEVKQLLANAGFRNIITKRFFYGLNYFYIATA